MENLVIHASSDGYLVQYIFTALLALCGIAIGILGRDSHDFPNVLIMCICVFFAAGMTWGGYQGSKNYLELRAGENGTWAQVVEVDHNLLGQPTTSTTNIDAITNVQVNHGLTRVLTGTSRITIIGRTFVNADSFAKRWEVRGVHDVNEVIEAVWQGAPEYKGLQVNIAE